VRSPVIEEAVRADAQGAERSGASSTPTFYIEGGLLVGAQPLPVFRQVLDSIIRVKARAAGKQAESP
jgi:protein-disulfide isomerase